MEFKHRNIIIQFNLNVYWEAYGALQKPWRSILCSLQFYALSPRLLSYSLSIMRTVQHKHFSFFQKDCIQKLLGKFTGKLLISNCLEK